MSREERAEDFLRRQLLTGPKAFTALEAAAAPENISRRQLYEARDRMNLRTVKKKWALPEADLSKLIQAG
jgi:hypothetical protein